MTLEEALRCIEAQFHLPPVDADAAGVHYYQFGELTVGLWASDRPGFLAASARVGTIDPGHREAVTILCQANQGLAHAPEAHLSLDDQGEVYLEQCFGGEEMTDDMFLDSLDRLSEEAGAWRAQLQRIAPAVAVEG